MKCQVTGRGGNIENVLTIRDRGVVGCTPKQRDAVERITEDVGIIQDGKEENPAKEILESLFDSKTKTINASEYTF